MKIIYNIIKSIFFKKKKLNTKTTPVRIRLNKNNLNKVQGIGKSKSSNKSHTLENINQNKDLIINFDKLDNESIYEAELNNLKKRNIINAKVNEFIGNKDESFDRLVKNLKNIQYIQKNRVNTSENIKYIDDAKILESTIKTLQLK